MASKEEQFYNACNNGNLPLVQQLSNQVDINWVKATDGNLTGLHWACYWGRTEMVKFLVTLPQLDVNKTDSYNITPLWYASEKGYEEIVKILLASGKSIDTTKKYNDPGYPTYHNTTAAGIARKNKYSQIASLVDDYQRNPQEVTSRLRRELNLPPLQSPSPSTSNPIPVAAVSSPSPSPSPSPQDKENEKLRKELEKVKQDFESLKKELQEAKTGLANETQKRKELENSLQQKDQKISILEKDLKDAKTQLTTETKKREDLEKTVQEKHQKISLLEKELATETKKRGDLEKTVQSITSSAPLSPAPAEQPNQVRWWDLKSQTSIQTWDNKGSAAGKYFTLKIIENGQNKVPDDDEVLKKLRFLLPRFGTDISEVKTAQAISSPLLMRDFESNLIRTNTQHRMNPDIFKKNDWTQGTNSAEVLQRFRFWYYLHQNRSLYDFDASHLYEVLPMLHGCDEKSAPSICETGFAFVGSTDPGYFGQGMYFTSSFLYGLNYAKKNSQGLSTFLVCLVAPGNAYPVLEQPFEFVAGRKVKAPRSLIEKPCKAGYQSHFTVVDRTAFPDSYPIKGDIDPSTSADELVVFQEKQVLPLFLITV